ncbi:MAG: ATP-binding protein [Verrucomicrobia bacterium]|nr:ATP-binding protein [Verrucomicrobiota bacterium]
MYERSIKNNIQSKLFQGRALIVYGARQTGKTTLAKQILEETTGKTLYMNCDEPDVRLALSGRSSTELKAWVGAARLLVIDEAQRVENIGLTLKLMVDEIPEVQVLATGSSSFTLANRIQEPLTGRKFVFHLHPLSTRELLNEEGRLETQRLMKRRLIFGQYPDVVRAGERDAVDILRELTGSYLYQDILMWKDIRKPELLDRLLRALALQIGNEVSYNELAQTLGVDKNTVSTYLDVLEQAFVVFRLNSFSRNLRTELRKSRKIYFWDNGIRNALLNNLNPVELRNDVCALWENFLVVERIKRQQNERSLFQPYFWRTHQQQEIDYIEDQNGALLAAEFKWKAGQKSRAPKAFQTTYSSAEFLRVDPENWLDFVG